MDELNFAEEKTYLWGTGFEGQSIMSWWEKNFPKQRLFIIEDNIIPEDADIVIKSPGVSIYLPQIEEAQKRGVKFTSLMNIFLSSLNAQKKRPTTIAVTGSKGKSTTVSMLNYLLCTLGFKSVLGGNIGSNPLDYLGQDLDYIVLELSSFQITDLEQEVDYGMVLNISQAHTDWHLSFENYRRDKLKLVTLCEHPILNYQDEYLRKIPLDNLVYYGNDAGFKAQNGKIYENGLELRLPQLQIFGEHNLSNLCGVLTIMKELHLDYKEALSTLKDFAPLEHRLQKVYEKNGLIFINDSIATLPSSTMAGVNSFNEEIALIVGGYDNGPDYSELNRFIETKTNIKVALCLPDTGRMLKNSKCRQVADMKEAVSQAIEFFSKEKNSHAKKVILLSPAAQSFNLYKNYKERGYDFTTLAKELSDEII